VVFLTVEIGDVPWVSFHERVTCERLGNGCWRVRMRFGFMNRPDVMRALDLCGAMGLEFDMMQTSFFLSRQQIVPSAAGPSTMARWRERMFAAMARNAANVTDYFNIPTNRVIELGTRVEI
jgi:KUP system potassium uptake protein